MFDQLVQSSSHDTAKQGAYMGITTLVYGTILTAVMVWSVFSFDLSGLNEGNLTYSDIIAPVVLAENVPTVIMPDRPQSRVTASPNDKRNVDEIRNPVKDIRNSTAPPDKTSTDPSNTTAVRDDLPFIISGINRRASSGGNDYLDRRNPNTGSNTLIKINPPEENKDVDIAPTLPPKPPVVKKDITVSRGVMNGIATSLPKPAYPPAARQIRAGGEVKVQVLIDERGNVVSATAVSGHPLLRAAAQSAARNAKFTPTQLSNQPVKVNGVIIYNFVPQ